MDKRNVHLETLTEIRSLMERSSRFISLSGLSGVFAGIFALIGAGLVYAYLGVKPFDGWKEYYKLPLNYSKWGFNYIEFFLTVACSVLVLALSTGIYFTTRKARKKGQKIFDKLTGRLLISLAIPLCTGGLVCLALIHHNMYGIVAPCTLIFYGLALINAGKFTLPDIYYLGICEILLGLFGIFFLGYGLDLWAIGFGVLHIVYGTLMYFKYERD